MRELEFYLAQRRKIAAFDYVDFLTEWDAQTDAAAGSIAADSVYQAALSEMKYRLTTDPEFERCVDELYLRRDKLDEALRHEIEVVRRSVEDTKRIPMDEYARIREITAKGYPVYVDAKKKGDFALFRPYLEQIVDYNRKLTVWLERPQLKGYDVLLDRYEPHYTQAKYDAFFNMLRDKLVPFVRERTAHPTPVPQWTRQRFDKAKQREFCEYIRDVMCFDKNFGIMKESEHPFTSGIGTDDVRITTHYYENDLVSSIFSVIHETGHATYERQCDPALNGTLSGGGASLGMHESQSRFYENMIGRSRAFWAVHYPRLRQIFAPQLDGVGLDEFVAYINRTEASFIRTEADELTYPLHIMLRYEIEQQLIGGKLRVGDLPEYWNGKFTEYFGITPPDDAAGVLQDVHWAYGDFGYFPTYALGSAIAAQLYHAMSRDFDVEQSLASGTTREINAWLGSHVHRYGASKYPDEILRLATGEDFDPNYYVDYLINKYSV